TMDTTRAEQIALDEALVAPANRLKIGKINLQLSSDLKSKEATLQVWRDKGDHRCQCQQATSTLEIICCSYQQVSEWHEDTQLYGVILPIDLINEAIKDSEIYKEYYAIASGAEPPKTKASVKKKQVESDKAKTPLATKGKRLKTTAKVTKPSIKKQPTQGLETLSEVALTEEEQMRIVTKRSLTEYHSSHASRSGANKGTGVTPGVPDVPKYESENDDDNDAADNQDDDGQEYDEHDDEEQGDDDEQTDSDNNGDDFVHPNDEEIQDANVEGNKMNEEEINEEAEVDALYRDVNVNLEGRDTEMTDAPRTIVQTTQVIEDTHVIITPVNPEGQQQSSSVSSGFISNMLNPSPGTFSSIPGIVDVYLANKMHKAVKTAVQLQSKRLKDKAQAENADFINKIDDNINKIIKDQVKEQVKAQVSKILPKIEKTVNEQLEAEVLTRSLNESKTSYAIAANLSELELKKILIDKIERKEKTSKTTSKSTEGSKSHHKTASESAQAEELMHTAKDLEELAHQEFETVVTKDQPYEETSQHPDWFQKPAKPPTYDRDWNMLFGPDGRFAESARDVHSKRRIIAVTNLQIVEWHNYKHLDWITVRRDDSKL
ncbi:retrovirus-related pol polyprotein from transposon TNT 1-94, partial [Tanacetum coccineum]